MRVGAPEEGSISMTLLALIGISLFKTTTLRVLLTSLHVLPNSASTFHDNFVSRSVDLQDLALVAFVGPGHHLDLVINSKFHVSS